MNVFNIGDEVVLNDYPHDYSYREREGIQIPKVGNTYIVSHVKEIAIDSHCKHLIIGIGIPVDSANFGCKEHNTYLSDHDGIWWIKATRFSLLK